MITPPNPGQPEIPLGPETMPPAPQQQVLPTPINVSVTEEEAKAIVTACNSFKRSMQMFAKDKKRTMRDSYAYSQSKFIGNDLLPLPASEGRDKDLQSNRPQVFIPKSRQLYKSLFSYLSLTLLPNDEDYFRVRSKVPEKVALEDALTDGLKYKFKEANIPAKIKKWLGCIVSMGNGAALPTTREEFRHEWIPNPETGEYVSIQSKGEIYLDVENLNPIYFYIDPKASNKRNAKWGYFSDKSKQELKDSSLYFNTKTEAFEKLGCKKAKDSQDQELSTYEFTGLQSEFDDIEERVDYDLFYIPYFKTATGQEYRNMLVGIAGGEILVRFHPNTLPRGLNPAVFQTWMEDPQSPYGVGAMEDAKELQRLINMLYNHTLETLARIGNTVAVSKDTDMSQFWGVAARVAVCDDPQNDINFMTGDYSEVSAVLNYAGVLAAELTQVGGTSNPFQGGSNVDFKKTATELQILQENSISIIREVVEHIGDGLVQVLELLMYIAGDIYKEPVTVRVDDPVQGTRWVNVDYKELLSGDFVIELNTINPSQSKQAQVTTLTELATAIGQNPQVLGIISPIINKILLQQGVKDGPEMVQEILQKMQMMQQQQAQQEAQANAEAQQQQAMQSQQSRQEQLQDKQMDNEQAMRLEAQKQQAANNAA